MNNKQEVVQFVIENDIKFVRLAFVDLFGNIRNVSIMADELSTAFDKGFAIDATAIKGFETVTDSDLLLCPDPTTVSLLPWRPQRGGVIRLFCDIKYADGTDFEGDGRLLLKKALAKAENMGYKLQIGTTCEFYLFETDEHGKPTEIPLDNASYGDVAPLDGGENVRRDICLTLEEMGITPLSSHHERGPGQNAIFFKPNDGLVAADTLVNFKLVVKAIAARNGTFASFMPKPIQGTSGSGLHINFKLIGDTAPLQSAKEQFVAGILNRSGALSVFLNPTVNSYERLGEHNAPSAISWSFKNGEQLIRVFGTPDGFTHVLLRSADVTCNPYLAFGLTLLAGLEGIENGEELQAECSVNGNLPKNLIAALKKLNNNSFISANCPSFVVDMYKKHLSAVWKAYVEADDKEEFVKRMYFDKA